MTGRKWMPIFLCLLAGPLVTACGDSGSLSKKQLRGLEQVARIVAVQDDRVMVADLANWLIEGRQDFVLIDLRPSADYEKGHISGARNLAVTKLVQPAELEALPTDRKVILYSQGSELAAQAVVLLRLAGRDANLLLGGFNYWSQHVLNPDLAPILADGEYPRVSEEQAVACYFVGGDQAAPPPLSKPVIPFVPPLASPATPLPPPAKEHC